ncbi:MAG: methyltransferase domain-containing protein [Planctomycetaceae bacterium]|nr:methyltransferase domain-containing protein [Planctomycetaceae bacterium]
MSVETLTEDWTCAFSGQFADDFRQLVRTLPLDKLERIPPPKNAGLPFGHELRIARRLLTGGSSMLDQSGLSRIYLACTAERVRRLYQGLALGESLPLAGWRDMLGHEATASWIERGLLEPDPGDGFRCRFRLIVLGPLRFVVDHFGFSGGNRVHIGGDSLNMTEFLQRRVTDTGGAMLDVGTGSGLQLLSLSQRRDLGLGVDINPRAVRVASLNVKLNKAANCRIEERDAFDPAWTPERFRLVTWNLPFMFFPDDEVAANVDGHGGHLGIALTLRFVERLVDLLAPEGVAWLLTSAPVMLDGTNRLEVELAERTRRCGLEISTFVLQKYWDRRHAQFHRSHQIRSFESVMVRIQPGPGGFQRHPPNAVGRSVDWLRTILNER